MVRKQEKRELQTLTVVLAEVKQDQKLDNIEWTTDEK